MLLLAALLLAGLASTECARAQTGKIAGRVTDAASGEPLPGVNVTLGETTQGAVTDADGYYTVINIRPGTYDVRASFIGYAQQVVPEVRVNVNLTNEINFALSEEVIEGEEVIVTATRPIVQPDVSANVANLDPEQYEDLPVAGVSEVISLQAGIEPGLRVRGGGQNEVAFLVDGMSMRTGRDNSPFTNISFTSVEEMQVQTGGFNAEYGNLRAGLINVVTKEPSATRYTADALLRFQPAQAKSLGGRPEDFDSYYIRPVLDQDVNMGGTTDSWDPYTARQYNDFAGLTSVAENLQGNGFDIGEQELVELFRYQHRKDNTIRQPDYQADVTVGGPLLPVASDRLGDLRFLASYRNTQTSYLYPQARDAYTSQTGQLKLAVNPRRGMKLTVSGMIASERGVNNNQDAADVRMWQGTLPAYPWNGGGDEAQQVVGISRRGRVIFSEDAFALANIDHRMLGADFTHTLSANTFYEVGFSRISTKYRSHFPNLRDDSRLENGQLVTDFWAEGGEKLKEQAVCFGGEADLNGDGVAKPYCVGEEPFGFGGQGNLFTGETTGGHWVKTRDTSDVAIWTGKFDLTSQLNRFMQVKTGVEAIYSDYRMRYARVNLALVGPEPEAAFPWSQQPFQGAAYAQTKLEFQGMIANLGLRLDYFNANAEWWDYSPYDRALIGEIEDLDETLGKEATKSQLALSPRLGLSFPVTANSKIYFNYGHFRQMLNPSDIFGVEQSRSGGINVIGNPNHPMPKTVAYELGYDQNLFDQFLLRVSGFYRDVRLQPRSVQYESVDELINYSTWQPWDYEDVRGAEVTLEKNRGRWVQGFLNYTYLSTKEGDFGLANFFENSFRQQEYLRTSTDYRLNAPIPEPFARFNLIVLVPEDFGGSGIANSVLGDLRVNLLGEWRAGQKFTWDGGASLPELQENVRWRDYYNFDLRFTKHVNTPYGGAQLFIDVANVFNLKHMYRYAAFHPDKRDWEYYMWSLHLPEDTYEGFNEDGDPYPFIYGDDRPGDFREPGTPFQPVEVVTALDAEGVEPNEIAWFYSKKEGEEGYYRWDGSDWDEVPGGEVEELLDTKAYIDMPNLRFNTFLNPRAITLGLRISL